MLETLIESRSLERQLEVLFARFTGKLLGLVGLSYSYFRLSWIDITAFGLCGGSRVGSLLRHGRVRIQFGMEFFELFIDLLIELCYSIRSGHIDKILSVLGQILADCFDLSLLLAKRVLNVELLGCINCFARVGGHPFEIFKISVGAMQLFVAN